MKNSPAIAAADALLKANHVGFLFQDSFESCDEHGHASNWSVLKRSDLSHKHCSWEAGKYVITTPGNRHFPIVPPLSVFTLETLFTLSSSVFESLKSDYPPHPSLKLFFNYDVRTQTGWFVECKIEDRQWIAVLGHECGSRYQELEQQTALLKSSPSGILHLQLIVSNE